MTYEEELQNIVSLCESAKKAKNNFEKADGYLRAIEIFVSAARKKLKKGDILKCQTISLLKKEE